MPTICDAILSTAFGLAWLGQTALAQTPVLVRDINLTTSTSFTTASSSPSTPVVQGSLAFFRANDGVHGQELWVTDGTSAGTRLVLDISPPQVFDTNIFGITPLGGDRVVFNAMDGTHGQELWVSDGTAAGTQLVADINPGLGGSSPGGGTKSIVRLNDSTVLFAATGPSGTELYRSDGTAAGTSLVMDIEPGPGSSNPTRLTVFNGQAYFRASTTAAGAELWVSDGTAAGTHIVADLNPGADSNPDQLTVSGTRLYFVAVVASDQELYSFDGTTVSRVKNINPTSSGVFPQAFLVDVGGVLLFLANDGVHGNELWRSDGTDAGTYMVSDINPGSASGILSSAAAVNVGGRLFFAASTTGQGNELWTSDGTAAGTALVKDINPGSASSTPTNFCSVGAGSSARLFFSATDAVGGQELFVSDGTAQGTQLVLDGRINGDGAPTSLADFHGTLLCSIDDTFLGRELFRSDGTPGGTYLVKDIRQPNPTQSSLANNLTASSTRAMVASRGRLFFRASDGIAGQELWVSDGTPGGTTLCGDARPGGADAQPAGLTDVNDKVFFVANDGVSGFELWCRDPAVNGGTPYRVKDINPGAGHGIAGTGNLTSLNGLAIFVGNDGTGDEVYRSDGTEAGTFKIRDINATAGISAGPMFVLGNRAYFAATGDGAVGSELWYTDGSTVALAADLPPANSGSAPSNFAALNGVLYFSANGWINGAPAGTELWSFDPATGLAQPVKDIQPGPTSSGPMSLTTFKGKLYFVADTDATGFELFESDGTSAGTVLAAEAQPGPNNGFGSLTPPCPVGDKLFFFAVNTVSNLEPWVFDPAQHTLHMLLGPNGIDPDPTVGSASGGSFFDVNGIAYFTASDTGTSPPNIRLWRSDGTDAGTTWIDSDPGGATGVLDLVVVNDARYTKLFFTASSTQSGRELYVLSVCRADFNNSGAANVQDIFDFLSAWFDQSRRCDFDLNGSVQVQDVFAFLAAWFGGC